MAFGVYIHIPYCLQICAYCDFTKYRIGEIMPPAQYVELLKREIRSRSKDVPGPRELSTVYFGGGTPSLLEPSLILSILEELGKAGFRRRPDAEFTIEIDPGTVDRARLDSYLALGVNRFSVGAQSFNDRLLELVGRKHSGAQTVELLSILKSMGVNYSFDLLFALPTQTLEEVRLDVATALSFAPSHVSAYCLTVPESHPMSRGRAPEEEQVAMFDVIESTLATGGLDRYEISNFAKPGFESKHNRLYWTDHAYLGLGTSAHSYFPSSLAKDPREKWGRRFWNAPSLALYEKQLDEGVPETQIERLELHQALTDFCHTSLRLKFGLSENALRLKFGEQVAKSVLKRLEGLIERGLIAKPAQDRFSLSREGRLVANVVFEELTFLSGEFSLG